MLVVVLVPFARDQVREALFPQVAEGGAGLQTIAVERDRPDARGRSELPGAAASPGGVVGGVVGGVPAQTVPAAPPPQAAEDKVRRSVEADRLRRSAQERGAVVRGGREAQLLLQRRPGAGPEGRPADGSRRSRLGLEAATRSPGADRSGRDHTMRLVLASPGFNRFLTLLRLAAARGARLRAADRPLALASPANRRGAAAAALAALAALPRCRAGRRHAEPRAAAGAAAAAHAPRPLRAALRDDAEPRAAARRQPPRPERRGPRRGRRHLGAARTGRQLDAVRGEASTAPPPSASRASESGFLHLRLARGVHRVEAGGPVPPGDSFTLQFADPPRRARAEAPGWDVSGLRADGPAAPSILLDAPPRRARSVGREPRAATPRGSRSPARSRFGVTWTVTTHRAPRDAGRRADRGARPAPARRGADARGSRRREGRGRGRASAATRPRPSWQSTLAQTKEIVLKRARGPPVVGGVAAALQPGLVLRRHEPAAGLAHRRGRLRSRVPTVAGRDAHASRSPIRRGSRARPSRSITSRSTTRPAAGSSASISSPRRAAAASSRSC